MSAILVTGGEKPGKRKVGSSTELLHANGSFWCGLSPLPSPRMSFSQNGITSCGGGDTNETRTSCFTFGSEGWEKSSRLLQIRQYHVSWNRPDGKILLMGGHYSTSTEIVTVGGEVSESGYSLKHPIRYQVKFLKEQVIYTYYF